MHIIMTEKTALTIAKELTKKPIKDKGIEIPHVRQYKFNLVQQADILYTTSDNGFKYALVVVDNASRLCDAQPIKTKTALAVFNAFKKVYSRGILEFPTGRIEMDPGSEFNNAKIKKYFLDKECAVKYGMPNRHRNQALVENRNKLIGDAIFENQLVKEITTNKVNKQWIKDLPNIIKDINNKLGLKHEKKYPRVSKRYDQPLFTDRNNDLLLDGDTVRVQLDQPQSFHGKKLKPPFRSADIRWSPKIHKIVKVILQPSSPPLYLVNDIHGTAYTRNQLQRV